MSRILSFRTVCDCLSWPPPDALSQSVSAEDFSWTDLIALAHEYRVAPAVAAGLREAGIFDSLPKGAEAYFASIAAHSRQRNEKIRDQAIEVTKILNAIDVIPLFLKGGSHLLSGLYPDPGMREMSDLDILVPVERQDDCVAALGQNGVTRADDYIHPRAHHHQPLVRSDFPVPIELHHEVVAHPHSDFLRPGEMRETCNTLTLNGAQIAVPSPTRAAMLTMAHAELTNYDHIYGRIELRGLLDLALLAHVHGEALDWNHICRCFEKYGKRAALGYQLMCMSDLVGVSVRPPSEIPKMAQLLYRRALFLVEKPELLSLGFRLLRPAVLLGRELSDSGLRRRLVGNIADRAWWRRHLQMLMGR